MPASQADVQATFCATLVDEWIRGGVRHAVIAPGSRSTPMALALANRSELQVHVFHDERAAAFCALGIGRAQGGVPIALCTSGTAAAHFHAAVIEADLEGVPLLVVTADRPPELRDTGAAQTIDQTHLYGRAARWFHDPGVPMVEAARTWRPLAARALAEANQGPVHLNLAFREPLLGTAGDLPEATERWSLSPEARLDDAIVAVVAEVCRGERGLIVTGGFSPLLDVRPLSDATGWPILSEPRNRRSHPNAVSTYDGLLRNADFARRHRPDVVLRFGPAPASRFLSEWLQSSGARQVQVRWNDTWLDPRLDATTMVRAEPGPLIDALVGRLPRADARWTNSWRDAEACAQAAIDAALPAESEPAVARTLLRTLPRPSQLVVASSMPIRDIEWYTEPVDGVVVHANRGANGIDGTIATAIGVALAQPAIPTTLLIGDIAFLHDQSALVGLMRRGIDLTIVVVDNDGGAIFSFLPQRAALDHERYEQLFGTPHGADIAAIAVAYGLPLVALSACAQPGGTRLVHIRSDRASNAVVHAALNGAIVAAVDPG